MEDFPENKFGGFFWEEGREGLGQAYQDNFEVLRLSNSLIWLLACLQKWQIKIIASQFIQVALMAT